MGLDRADTINIVNDAVTASKLLLSNILVVDPSGGEYTTIQSALDVATDGDCVLVTPGTYNEALTFQDDNITLRSLGGRGATISREDVNVIDFGAYTGIYLEQLEINLDFTSTVTADMIIGTGIIHIKNCNLNLSCDQNISGTQPYIVNSAGAVHVSRCGVNYSHSGTTGAGIKAAFAVGDGGIINLYRVHVTINNSGTAAVSVMGIDTAAGAFIAYRCLISVTDSTATLVAGSGYLGGTGSHEFMYNDIHVSATAGGGGNTAYGLFIVAGTAKFRFVLNHIHVESTNGNAYSFLQAGNAVVTSQLDDIVAAQGYLGTVILASSEVDGEGTFTSGLLVGKEGQLSHNAQITQSAGEFDIVGDGQAVNLVARALVVHDSSTWRNLYLDGVDDLITIRIDGVWTFDILIVGTTEGCDKSFGFHINGVVERNSGEVTEMSILYSNVDTYYDGDDTDFDAQVDVSEANKALLVQVKDSTSGGDTVRWVANIRAACTSFIP